MRRSSRRWAVLIGLGGILLSSGGLLHCYSTEDASVAIETQCDPARLDGTEASVTTFLRAADQFTAKTQSLSQRMTDICNQINKDLGMPVGANMRDACNSLATRIAAASKKAPDPKNGTRPIWVALQFQPSCENDSAAEAKCYDTCSGKPPCDVAAACPPANLVGACTATCKGYCRGTATTDSQVCVGECEGRTSILDGGTPLTCNAACEGTCPAGSYLGLCETGCTAAFVGECQGTCTGKCDGMPIGPQPVDAGLGPEAGEGGVDASAPPPSGADGNCKGVCDGVCSSKASGTCKAKCTGAFAGGACGPCVGSCDSAGQASVAGLSTCRGTCRYNSGSAVCNGVCNGGCSVPLTNPTCTVGLTCEADTECKRSCRLEGALAAKCSAPAEVDLRVAGDYALYSVLKKNGPALAALLKEVQLLGPAVENARDRTTGDFHAVGIRRDLAFRCVERGTATITAAAKSYADVVSATQFIKGTAF